MSEVPFCLTGEEKKKRRGDASRREARRGRLDPQSGQSDSEAITWQARAKPAG